jgi:uncharacterized membrane protein YeaQ/YmgE (transglycosylase-associated protein family)
LDAAFPGEFATVGPASEWKEKTMNAYLFFMWIATGLVVGWMAGHVLKNGGYGPKGDLGLGIVGSIAASGIVWGLGVSTAVEPVVLIIVAFIGAAIAIGAQRMLWHVHA